VELDPCADAANGNLVPGQKEKPDANGLVGYERNGDHGWRVIANDQVSVIEVAGKAGNRARKRSARNGQRGVLNPAGTGVHAGRPSDLCDEQGRSES
jgi:hypothetical protein